MLCSEKGDLFCDFHGDVSKRYVIHNGASAQFRWYCYKCDLTMELVIIIRTTFFYSVAKLFSLVITL